MVGAPMSALLHAVRARDGPLAPAVEELPSWIPRIEVHKHCSQRLGHGIAASHQAKLATHPCVDRLPSEIALFASAPPARLHFQVTRLAAGGLDGASPDLGSIVSALKQLAPGGNNRASVRANAAPLLRVTSSLDIKRYGEAPALVAALASSIGARGPSDDGSASSSSIQAAGAVKTPSAPALRTGLLARSMARMFGAGTARLSEQAADAEAAEGGVVLPVLLVDEALVPSLEGGKEADWGVAHMGEGAAEEDGRPALVVVGVVRRRGDVEAIDVEATVAAAGSVLRLVGALPPPGSAIAEGQGQWAARSWGEAVTSVGESAAVAMAWPSVLVRGLAAARLQAASAMLSAARIDGSNEHLLDTRLWSGLVERWAGTAKLQAKAAELGREALGVADRGGEGKRRGPKGSAGVLPGERASAPMSGALAEADDILFRSMAQGGVRVPKSVTSVVAMTSEQFVGLVVACVDVASEGKTKLPGRLPPSMGARHRMCAKMAAAVKDMGYLREFAYNHLLYPSASETRDVLQWLAGRLPRPEEDNAGAAGPSGPEAIAREAAVASLRAWSSQPEPAPAAMQLARDASRAALAEEDGGPAAESLHRLFVAQARGSGKAARAVPLRADAALALQVSDAQSLADSLLETAAVRRARAAAVAAAGGRDAATEAETAAFARTRALAARGFASAAAGGGACGEGEAAGVGGGLALSSSGAGGFSGLGLAQLAAAVRASREDLGRNAFLLSAEFAQDRAVVTDGTGAGEDDQDKGAGQGDRARTDEEVAADRAAELAAEEERRLAATARAAAARAKRSATEDALLAELERLAELRKRIAAAEAELALQQRALELAEGDHEGAAEALRTDVAERQGRLASLAEEWEAHRRPLVDAAAELRGSAARAEARAAELEEEAATLRGEMRSLADAVREREAEALALRRKEEALPKDAPSRREYVERILGIVKQSRKQEAEERGIARDIARVQAETSRLTGALSRSRAAVHDAIFAEVERNRSSVPHREAARAFTGLQEAFAALLTALRDTATADAELRDLALSVDSLKQRSAARNRDDVMRDLALLKAENADMEARLRAAGIASV